MYMFASGKNMDTRNTRHRKPIESLSQAITEPTLKRIACYVTVCNKRRGSIENDLLKDMTAIGDSIKNAHCRTSDEKHQISSLQCQLKGMKNTRKNEHIIQESLKRVLRSVSWTDTERQHLKLCPIWSTSPKVFNERLTCSLYASGCNKIQ